MYRRNLTLKILAAVGVTVAMVIGIYTYFVIRVQSAWWHERTQAQNLITATMVHEYLNGVMLSERHLEVERFLVGLQDSEEIRRGRIIRPDGTVAFSTEPSEIGHTTMTVPAALFGDNRVVQGERVEHGERLAVVMRPVPNLAGCQRCHHDTQPVLGAIVLEKSMGPAEANIASSRMLLLVYGAVIFVLVGTVLWLLIMRFVSQPVGNVLEQMGKVKAGDLTARAEIEAHDEIGELAHGFNEMVTSLDNTQRELRESHDKQIQQADKLASIGELASGIAHEICNPLAGIGAAVEILAETSSGQGLNGQYQEVVGEIRQQIKRLNNTLHDLLDFARVREPEMAPCAVADLVKPMLTLVRPDAQKHHIQIVEEYAPELPAVHADVQQIQQALLNIFLNALQAMPDGGTLTVACHSERPAAALSREGEGARNRSDSEVLSATGGPAAGGRCAQNDSQEIVRLAIRDTGCGIPAETLPKIFSPFFTTKHRGTGLGLAIVRSIVEKHHGSIAVQSAVGQGTTFVLEFAACHFAEGAPHG